MSIFSWEADDVVGIFVKRWQTMVWGPIERLTFVSSPMILMAWQTMVWGPIERLTFVLSRDTDGVANNGMGYCNSFRAFQGVITLSRSLLGCNKALSVSFGV